MENIIAYFKNNPDVEVSVVISNKADAYAVTRAKNHGIPCSIITRKQFEEDKELVMNTVKGCDFIILAGCLVRIPEYMIEAYPKRIINIHPALLPKYGGKGMYGHHVHEAVKAAGEKESGITIHYVNNELDAGEHILRITIAAAQCNIDKIELKCIESDGIEQVQSDQPTVGRTAVYNLAGQRVANGQEKLKNGELPKGIYIVNGRKVMVR